MRFYDPDDDGLDDDNPYDYSNVNNEEAKEDIARMMLRQYNATEPEIVALLESLLPKYREYLKIYNMSDTAKTASAKKDIEKYNNMLNNEYYKKFAYGSITLAAIQRAQKCLMARMNFESEIDDVEREINQLPYTDPQKAKKLEYFEISNGIQTSMPYLECMQIYLASAPKINFQNYKKAKESEDKLNRAEEKTSKELESIRKTILDIHSFKEHLNSSLKEIEQNPNSKEKQILRKAEIIFENIDKQLNSRLSTYLNYAGKSKLKSQIALAVLNNSSSSTLKRDYINKLFDGITSGAIELNTPCQGE